LSPPGDEDECAFPYEFVSGGRSDPTVFTNNESDLSFKTFSHLSSLYRQPPAASMSDPVTYRASSEAVKTAMSVTSSGVSDAAQRCTFHHLFLETAFFETRRFEAFCLNRPRVDSVYPNLLRGKLFWQVRE
jgi:hypothetical protein